MLAEKVVGDFDTEGLVVLVSDADLISLTLPTKNTFSIPVGTCDYMCSGGSSCGHSCGRCGDCSCACSSCSSCNDYKYK